MTGSPLVAVSYQVNGALRQANSETLGTAAELAFLADLDPAERAGALRRANVLIGWLLDRELMPGELDAAAGLRFVQLLSAGADGVNFAAIPDHIVLAGNVGAYAKPIAEHGMAMALSLAKRLPQRHAGMARGHFDQQSFSLTLDGAVCAILGFGGIGKSTARLMRAFGARIYAVNTSGQTTEPVDFVGTLADLGRVLGAADVLVIALPLTRSTRGIIARRELAMMKPNAILINVARADIVDQGALYAHLRDNPEFTAGIDTWWQEPLHGGSFRTEYPFFDLPNMLGSPHNSGIVRGILESAAQRAAENVLRYLRGVPLTGVVRREDYLSPPPGGSRGRDVRTDHG